jgi:hypothetical protein
MVKRTQQFSPYAGRGVLFKNGPITADRPDVTAWHGHLGDPATGERLVLQATGFASGRKPHYDVRVLRPTEDGTPWTALGSFTIPAFGDKPTLVVSSKELGQIRCTRIAANAETGTQAHIRLRVGRKPGTPRVVEEDAVF